MGKKNGAFETLQRKYLKQGLSPHDAKMKARRMVITNRKLDIAKKRAAGKAAKENTE